MHRGICTQVPVMFVNPKPKTDMFVETVHFFPDTNDHHNPLIGFHSLIA